MSAPTAASDAKTMAFVECSPASPNTNAIAETATKTLAAA